MRLQLMLNPRARRRGRRRSFAWLSVALGALLAPHARAQVADVDVRTSVFNEPSATSKLTVIHPGAAVVVRPTSWLGVNASYDADIVTGATEAVKRGRLADIVTQASDFSDTRHVVGGGFSITRASTELSANYAYGFESDYKSQSFTVAAGTDFLQKNTKIELSYGRGFDEVCTTAFAETDAPSNRQALTSSDGCFSNADDRAVREINLDTFQAAWNQNWTPELNMQMVLTGALQNGFLENPYRSVEIAAAGDAALENHPDNRARGALALRLKYYVRPIKTAIGFGVRGYRDTWDILGQTYELSGERYLFPWLRLLVRGRYYAQTGALFWSDDYTGGEPETGPRGQYWSGDREVSPLASYSAGARLQLEKSGAGEARVFGIFRQLRAAAAFDGIKTDLKEFTWSGETPDDTLALLFTLTAGASF